jgi:hypothetical protein
MIFFPVLGSLWWLLYVWWKGWRTFLFYFYHEKAKSSKDKGAEDAIRDDEGYVVDNILNKENRLQFKNVS